jgi:lysosomal Pro-X carboxypeptidase
LIWELAAEQHAQVIFIEHRYEGLSKPSPKIPNCMAYSSSIQALADYANFIERYLFDEEENDTTTRETVAQSTKGRYRRPVIAFGGSYGGMLSAWMRMLYPALITGSIAASAPIWGFPRNFPDKIDSAWRVIRRGLELPYPPTAETETTTEHRPNYCATNLLASWPLMKLLATTSAGRNLLTKSFCLCDPLQSDQVHELLDWAQSPWFDLAEGSYPYPSNYITFALTHDENAVLPAWPLQAACWNASSLSSDFGIHFSGNLSDVRYEITYGGDGDNRTIGVDWNNATAPQSTLDRLVALDSVSSLLENVRKAVSVWFNVTKVLPCFNLTAAPSSFSNSNLLKHRKDKGLSESLYQQRPYRSSTQIQRRLISDEKNSTAACEEKMREGSWPSLCCNEGMNLIITEASGLGHDMLWPPSHPRGTKTHEDIIESVGNETVLPCDDPGGSFGYPQATADPWCTWYDVVFGGVHIKSHSNIVFSNGLLDPWSAAGVYASGMDPIPPKNSDLPMKQKTVPGLHVHNISDDGSMISIIMAYGGHHTDLMYSSAKDPPCIREGRRLEKKMIERWVNEWWDLYSIV